MSAAPQPDRANLLTAAELRYNATKSTKSQKKRVLRLVNASEIEQRSDTEEQLAAEMARLELMPIVESPQPNQSIWGGLFFVLVYFLRPFLGPLARRGLLDPFNSAMINAGGIERVALLLSIVRFDLDGDGRVDEQERLECTKRADRIVADTITFASNAAVVAGLLTAATHSATIGRVSCRASNPVP